MSKQSTRKTRNKSGSGLVLMALSVLVAVFTVGALGLDIAHNTTSRTSLQDATDAAALAGAAAIVLNSINPTNDFGSSNSNWQNPNLQYNDTNIGSAVQTAVVNMAANNNSDGHPVSAAAGVTLTSPSPAVNYYIKDDYTSKVVPQNNGQCLVNANETIQNLFAGIIGRPTDVVTTQSIASAYTNVSGVNANILFPIAVSLDTIVGHNGSAAGNYPLNSPLVQVSNPNNANNPNSFITFYMEDPCANAAWTTFNTADTNPLGGSSPHVNGANGLQLSQSAVSYINQMVPSVLGTTSFVGGSGSPAQFVGEQSSTGQAAYSALSGIDLWGALSGAGSSSIATAMQDKTLILPVIGGDQPFWNQDDNNVGKPYQPGARQTRPLLGFCAIHVTKAVWDAQNNCLLGFQGYLVKGLVKGTPGIVDPMVNPNKDDNGNSFNAADMAALANLSPGMVQLGNTTFNLSPAQIGNNSQVYSGGNPATDSWYIGNVPPNNNTVVEANMDIGNQTIRPIPQLFINKMVNDMTLLCGGVDTNETMNWEGFAGSPPGVPSSENGLWFQASGVGMLQSSQNSSVTAPNSNQPLPFTQLFLNPLSTKINIYSWYSDEVGLNYNPNSNYGYGIDMAYSNNSYGGPDPNVQLPQTYPRYVVLDSAGTVVSPNAVWSDPTTWPTMTVGPNIGWSGAPAPGVNSSNYNQKVVHQMSMQFDPQDLGNGTGEYLIVFHTFDTDLGYGGIGPPGTPPNGIDPATGKQLPSSPQQNYFGDPAFYYLDVQFPTCPSL